MHKQNKKDESLTLKGAKHERTMQMYVKNIEIECDEKTAEIEKKVKTYIEKGGVKILKVQVVKNHFVDTIVGCKIIILEKQKGFWKVTNSGQIILNVEYGERKLTKQKVTTKMKHITAGTSVSMESNYG